MVRFLVGLTGGRSFFIRHSKILSITAVDFAVKLKYS